MQEPKTANFCYVLLLFQSCSRKSQNISTMILSLIKEMVILSNRQSNDTPKLVLIEGLLLLFYFQMK